MDLTWKDVLDAIVNTLSSVSGIGNIWDHPLDLRSPTDFKQHSMVMLPDGRLAVNTCIVERTSSSMSRGPSGQFRISMGHLRVTDTFRVILLYSYYDGGNSLFEFQGLLERVMLALAKNITLGEANCVAYPPSATIIELREFGDILCHYAEITVNVERDSAETFA